MSNSRVIVGHSLLLVFAWSMLSSAAGPVQVFILSGQSNMEGKAAASTLEPWIANEETRNQFSHLKSGDDWAKRDDVWVTYLDRTETDVSPRSGPLSVGFGSPKRIRADDGKRRMVQSLGPELGIGWVLGDHFEEPVLLIKAAWGGRALKHTFRPPSDPPTEAEIKEQLVRVRKKNPDATYQEVQASYGRDYRKIHSEVQRALSEIARR